MILFTFSRGSCRMMVIPKYITPAIINKYIIFLKNRLRRATLYQPSTMTFKYDKPSLI